MKTVLNGGPKFQEFLKERANEMFLSKNQYIMMKIMKMWEDEGYDREEFMDPPRKREGNHLSYPRTYIQDGIVCTKEYGYEESKKVVDMYNQGMGTVSIARELGKHQKTIWRIIDRNRESIDPRRLDEIKRYLKGSE